ncbi:MAG: RNA polymerase sigma factor [Acidobacteria bacterium]|nr:RNA polymerase sigma factor [Acidobacteriota bacterium]
MKNAEFESIFEANKDAVFAFAWRMTGTAEVAEDIAQDCFLSLLKADCTFDGRRGSARAWLLGAARNQIYKRWRSEGRWVSLDDDFIGATDSLPGDWDIAEKVAFAVRSLPPLQREIVLLIEFEGMTLQEAADAVEADVGTVKARLHRARENLRGLLEPLRSTNHDR